MNQVNTIQRRNTVSLPDMMKKVIKTQYYVIPDTTTTICQLSMENGYVVVGTSACVDPLKFNQALGEKYSYENAIDKLWPLEGYLLAEELFKNGN